MISYRFLIAVFTLIGAIFVTQNISHGKPTPPKQNLQNFPLEIDSWKGKSAFFGPEIENVAGMDHYILRQYVQQSGQSLWLYVGYYESQQRGDIIHSPKNCIPGNGWQPIDNGIETITVSASPAKEIEVNRYIIRKGLETQVVLYWYQSRGRVYSREIWGKFYLVLDSITKNRTDGSLVRVSAPVVDTIEETLKREKAFIQGVFPVLTQYIPD